MSHPHDTAFEDEARALLGAVRSPPAAPAEAKARALRRLSLALVGLDGGAGPPPNPPAPNPPDQTGAASAGRLGAGNASVAGRLARALGTRVPAWSLLGSFVAGGALALAVAPRMLGRPEVGAAPLAAPAIAMTAPLPAAVEAPAVAPAASAAGEVRFPESLGPAPPATMGGAPIPPAPAPSARIASSSAAPRASAEEHGLEAEHALLVVARAALARGDGGAALAAAEEHARRFPRGMLAEEREAMSIQALRLLGRGDEAQARLGRFRARFPASLIRPALEAAAADASADGGAP